MRSITSHQVNPANDILTITVTDEPGAGGANHHYVIAGYKPLNSGLALPEQTVIAFQNGPIKDPTTDVNGVTHEALLAIVIDRLESFQAGPYACAENALALLLARESQRVLQSRTLARMVRGVEGTHTV